MTSQRGHFAPHLFDFLCAGCYANLGDDQRKRQLLQRAMATIAPDGLWLIAAEFEPTFGQALYEAAQAVDAAAPEHIRQIGSGYWDKLAHLCQDLDRHAPSIRLTKREKEVAELMRQGKTNAQIAASLYITERTVKSHLEHIYRKFQVQHRRELMEVMDRSALIQLAEWTNR